MKNFMMRTIPMSDTENGAPGGSGDDGDTPSARELEDAAVDAMRKCEADSDTPIDGAPRGAVVDVLQDEHGINKETALQAILDAQMGGQAYITKGPDETHQQHVRAPDEPDPMEDPRDDIAGSGDTEAEDRSDIDPAEDFPDSPEDLDIPPEEAPPDPPEEERQPDEEESDYILDDDHPEREPEFPGMMSGESIRLRGDEDEEWREPRTMY